MRSAVSPLSAPFPSLSATDEAAPSFAAAAGHSFPVSAAGEALVGAVEVAGAVGAVSVGEALAGAADAALEETAGIAGAVEVAGAVGAVSVGEALAGAAPTGAFSV